ncbi:MAG: hypothetical protein LBQ79_09830 [Deltaproteobacteria bacterium]|jgi:hypothetical protein|nr:hypothetical protein [Deltaproteobacteria bacterium]
MRRHAKAIGIAIALALCLTLVAQDAAFAQRNRDDRRGSGRNDRERDRHDRDRGRHGRHGGGVTYDPDHGTYVDQFGRTVSPNGNRLDAWGKPIPDSSRSYRDPQSRRGDLLYDGMIISPRAGVVISPRTDLSTWPQTSLRFSYGALGEYVRWRGGIRGAWGRSGIEGMFTYVDDHLRASLAVNPRLTRADLDYTAVTVIRSYVDTNVAALAVQDGEFYVQYRTQTQGRTSSADRGMYRTYVTETGADSAFSAANPGGASSGLAPGTQSAQ